VIARAQRPMGSLWGGSGARSPRCCSRSAQQARSAVRARTPRRLCASPRRLIATHASAAPARWRCACTLTRDASPVRSRACGSPTRKASASSRAASGSHRACARPASSRPILISSSGLGGCPPNAVMAYGTARADVRLVQSGQVIPEYATLTVLSGPIEHGATRPLHRRPAPVRRTPHPRRPSHRSPLPLRRRAARPLPPSRKPQRHRHHHPHRPGPDDRLPTDPLLRPRPPLPPRRHRPPRPLPRPRAPLRGRARLPRRHAPHGEHHHTVPAPL